MRPGAVARSSVRSHGGSSTSTTASDPREKIKDCCRKLVAFMCTQVGVGGLIVCYAIFGALGFISIETQSLHNPHTQQIQRVRQLYANSSAQLWSITEEHNTFSKAGWYDDVDTVLKAFQDGIIHAVKRGYDGSTVEEKWSFPAALMFCLSIFTMIGYGNMVPRTAWGKGVTVVYAVFGIPLYILYFMNMGEILAQTFRWLYTWFYDCSTPSEEQEDGGDVPKFRKRITVPSTACLWVISGYVLTGAIMFAEWENWNYLDSTYFCVTSLCKIGFGDFVPGTNIADSRDGNQTKLIINFVYMLLGMGLVAMCYNLMREDVRVKMREVREDLCQCMEDLRLRFIACAGRCKHSEEP